MKQSISDQQATEIYSLSIDLAQLTKDLSLEERKKIEEPINQLAMEAQVNISHRLEIVEVLIKKLREAINTLKQ